MSTKFDNISSKNFIMQVLMKRISPGFVLSIWQENKSNLFQNYKKTQWLIL
jgi:hypothetical protein